MTLAAALYAHLTTDAPLAALVGSRVYPAYAPQADENAAYPATLVFALENRKFDYVLGGKALTYDTWTFVSVSSSYDQVHGVNDAVLLSLDHYRGTLGGAGGVAVQTIQLVGTRDAEEGVELGIYQVYTTFEIVY